MRSDRARANAVVRTGGQMPPALVGIVTRAIRQGWDRDREPSNGDLTATDHGWLASSMRMRLLMRPFDS